MNPSWTQSAIKSSSELSQPRKLCLFIYTRLAIFFEYGYLIKTKFEIFMTVWNIPQGRKTILGAQILMDPTGHKRRKVVYEFPVLVEN
jgi:hypothetical protein